MNIRFHYFGVIQGDRPAGVDLSKLVRPATIVVDALSLPTPKLVVPNSENALISAPLQ